MKKIFTLITAIMLFAGVSKSQQNIFWINLDSADNYNQINLGMSYSRFAWYGNMNYTLADTPHVYSLLRYVEVAFDTLVDSYNGNGPIPYSSTQHPVTMIDSIMAYVGQVNYSGTDDTVIFKILAVDSNGYPTSTVYWSDSFIIAAAAPLDTGVGGTFNGYMLSTPVGYQPPTSKFVVRIEYYGSILDTFIYVIGCPSFIGSLSCTGLTLPDTSSYRHNTLEWYLGTGGYDAQYPTINGQDIFIDQQTFSCDSIASYFQNANIYVKVEVGGIINNCNGFTASTNPTPAQCGNCADGWISCTHSGGTPPYHFSWNTIPVQTTQDAMNLLPGTYTVTITDSNNCTTTSTATVGSANFCSANFLLYPDSIPHTWYILNQSTGTQPIHYNWNWGDSTAHDTTEFPSHTYADTGYYTICLSILDAVGCSTSYCNSYYLNRMENAMVNVFVIGSTTGIKEVSNPASVEIIPNPNNGNFVLSYHLPNSQLSPDQSGLNSQFILKDVLGRTVYNKTIPDTDGIMTINASELGSGIYYWEVITNSRIAVNGKIALEK